MNDHVADRSERCAIAVMAKAPSVGRVKTRLSPLLSPQEAMDLGCCFLADITANLARAALEAPIDPFIAFAPAGSEPAFASIVAPGTGFVLADGSRAAPLGVVGLGASLLQGGSALLEQGYGAVALINADSPTLPTSVQVEAARLLLAPHDRVVIGPSDDGGYYLVGMRRPHAEPFLAIEWSTERVVAQTRQRARGYGLEVAELVPWYDVDDADSLLRLLRELASAPAPERAAAYPAPATRAFLERNALAERIAGLGVTVTRPRTARDADADASGRAP
jgi:rSAM/selenodomain-associated transferase 1